MSAHYDSWDDIEGLDNMVFPEWVTEAEEEADANVATVDSVGAKRWTSNATGLEMHGRHFGEGPETTRHIFLFHGLAEHCNKYSYTVLAERLAKQNFAIHMHDMQGHGYSGALTPRRMKDSKSLIDDAWQFVQDTLARNSNATEFAFISFSTGGALGVALAMQKLPSDSARFVGHYMMAPLITNPIVGKLGCCLGGFVDVVGRLVLACCCCTQKMLKAPYTTRKKPWNSFIHPRVYDIEVTKDKLNWQTTHAMGNFAILSALARTVTPLASKLDSPFRVAKGTHDGILNQSANQLFEESPFGMESAAAGRPVIRLFEKQVHCLIQSPEGESVVTDIEESLFMWFGSVGSA